MSSSSNSTLPLLSATISVAVVVFGLLGLLKYSRSKPPEKDGVRCKPILEQDNRMPGDAHQAKRELNGECEYF